MATVPPRHAGSAVPDEDDALQRLIVQCYPRLRLRLQKELGGDFQRYFDVDDILQEAFIAAFRAPAVGRPRHPRGFYHWLERVALNDLIDAKRALLSCKRDIRRVAKPDPRSSMIDVVQRLAVSETPSRCVAKEEASAAAMSCLARLSEEQRQVICSRFLEHRSVAEVASEMGKTEPAIHALCYRALQALRGHLGSISRYLSKA
jgi:RNA polymerase sigma factor (sigma-70 family)